MTEPTPATQPVADAPLDDTEVEALDALLEARADAHGGMPLEAVDGFFSALIVGPGQMVMPSTYLSEVVGDAPWDDAQQAREAMTLLMRLWNHIAWRVRQPMPGEDGAVEAGISEEGFELMPFIALPGEDDADDDADPFAGIPEDYPVGALWAAGFLQGVALQEDAWAPWLEADEDLRADLADLMRLSVASGAHAEEMEIAPEDRLDLEARWALLSSVPGLLADLNETRIELLQMRTPIRRAPVPGRNDPCTCGSGRKWKKCCGVTLH